MVINFTISGTSHPNTTQVPLMITNLYKNAYEITGDPYAAYDAGNEHAIIDTDVCKTVIVQEAEEIVQAWYMSSPAVPPPSSSLSREGIKKIKSLVKRGAGRITNIRLWNETWDDY